MSSRSHLAAPPRETLVARVRVAATLACVMALPAVARAQAPSIDVLTGDSATVPGTYDSGTYSSVTVSGTGAAGRSTLTINAPVALDGSPGMSSDSLSVAAGGLLNVNANVTSSVPNTVTSGSVGGGGTLNLVSGTLALSQLTLSGNAAFQRSGGSETLRVTQVDVTDGATLVLSAGDDIGILSVGVSSASAGSITSTVTPAPGSTVFSVPYLNLGPGGSVVGLDSIPYSVQGLYVGGQRVEYRAGAITDTITEYFGLYDSGTLALQQDLALAGSNAGLSISGTGCVFEFNGHAVTTPQLAISDGARVAVGDGITVTRNIALYSEAAGVPTELVLTRNLVLSESDGRDPAIDIFGTNNRIVRSSPGLTITATNARITVFSGSFTMQAGDDFAGSAVSILNGGTVSNAGPQSLISVDVSGTAFDTGAPSTYRATGPLTLSGSAAFGPNLRVNGGRFEAAANVSADTADVSWGGVLALLSGTFTATDTLAVSGSDGGVVVDRGAGAAYDVTQLVLSNGASMDFDAATDRVGILSLSSGAMFTTGTSGGGLDLTTLFITASGSGTPPTLLRLGSFGGTGGPGEWGLRTPDSQYAALQGWIADGSILALSGQPLTVMQQGGFAYVMTVPEPAALAAAAGGLAFAALAWRRRGRRGPGAYSAATTRSPTSRVP